MYEGRKLISQDDFKKACLRKFYEISDEYDDISEEMLKMRVVHEAGHVVVSEMCNWKCVNFVSVSSNRRGNIGGFVSRNFENKNYMKFEFQ